MAQSTASDLRTTTARRRAELVSDGVTASYIHELTHGRVPLAPARARRRGRPLALVTDRRADDRRLAA